MIEIWLQKYHIAIVIFFNHFSFQNKAYKMLLHFKWDFKNIPLLWANNKKKLAKIG